MDRGGQPAGISSSGRPGKTIVIPARQIKGLTGTTTGILEHARRLSALGYRVVLYGERLDRDRVAATGAEARTVFRLPFARHFRRHWFARRFETQRPRYDFVFGHGDVYGQDVLSMHDCLHAQHEAIHGQPFTHPSGSAVVHQRILTGGQFRHCIANSQLMKDDLVARFRLQPEGIRVIHPGYDPRKFGLQGRDQHRAEIRRELNIGADQVVVGSITSGNYQKRGIEIFIRALARLSPTVLARTQAVVVGKEKNLEPYLAEARAAGVGERLRFLPATAEVERVFHALDVYVFPARFEEFGQSVQEAYVCGVPVITSRRVGATELLPPATQKELMAVPEVEPVAREMEALITDAHLRASRAEAALQAARANTWDRNFQQTLEVFQANGL